MKTTHTTPTFDVSLTEVLIDHDNSAALELTFTAALSREYLETTPFGIENQAQLSEDLADESEVTYEFNVAQRHSPGLYVIIAGDRSGDVIDEYDAAVYAFGQSVIDFITSACRLLKVPLFSPE